MIRDFLIMVKEVVKESAFQCRGHRFNPWWGNQDHITTEPAWPQLEGYCDVIKMALFNFLNCEVNFLQGRKESD